ncbi:MAG TPA: hypothetical protein EYG44_04045 [Verrucomicrobia bacterium]|nr:hypothetical protein [Verrucomicrobiota bacterium]
MNGSVLPARNVADPMKPTHTHIARASAVETFRDQEFMQVEVASGGPSVKGGSLTDLSFKAGFMEKTACENPALRVRKTRLAKRFGLEAKRLRC